MNESVPAGVSSALSFVCRWEPQQLALWGVEAGTGSVRAMWPAVQQHSQGPAASTSVRRIERTGFHGGRIPQGNLNL